MILMFFSILTVCQGSFGSTGGQVWAANEYSGAPYLEISNQILPTKEWSAETENLFRVQLFNQSDVNFKDVTVAITLPEGLTFAKGSNAESVGYMTIGAQKKVDFPIRVEKNTETKSYAISVDVSAVGYLGESWNTTRVFYVSVKGGSSFSSDDIGISNITVPSTVEAEQDFTLSFQVRNSGNTDSGRLKISAEGGEGLVNKTRNIFLEPRIEKGSNKSYTVTFYAMKTETPRSNTIKITVEPDGGTKDTTAITQYGTVCVSGSSRDGGAKHLQLIVDQYSFGGRSIRAGDEFTLHLRLRNTSSTPLTNIKAAITAENGTFVPVGGSNSFYVESIGAKGLYEKSLRLTANPQAEQKAVPIILALTYEDGKGNSYEASETLSIPIVQDTRLTWDEPMQPWECYVGQPAGTELAFYNMGKGILYNLRINATGNFDTNESNSYYVGNMEGGKSDSYSFQFIPREPGTVEGVVTFTYEDAAGNPHTKNAAFSFPVSEMIMEPGDMGEFPPEVESTSKKGLVIGIGTGLSVLLAAFLLFRRWKRKKRERMLELEDIEI